MKVYRPIKTNILTQGFGENRACAKTYFDGTPYIPWQIVSKSGGVCPIGYKEFYPLLGMKGHSGEDWAAWHGEPLYFPVDFLQAGGWRSQEASDVDGGLGVDVISNHPVTLGDKTGHIKFRFWHLLKAWKDVDVEFGELIGYCDNTGASGGNHLHWAMKWCDKDGNSTDDNGYQGATDFRPWFENEFVLDVLEVKAKALSAIDLFYKVLFQIKQYLLGIKK